MSDPDLDAYLHSTQLLDCQGRVTHVLTVQPDGRIRVRRGALDATVDPRTRTVHPPGARLGAGEYSEAQVLDLACRLAGEVIR